MGVAQKGMEVQEEAANRISFPAQAFLVAQSTNTTKTLFKLLHPRV